MWFHKRLIVTDLQMMLIATFNLAVDGALWLYRMASGMRRRWTVLFLTLRA